MKTNKYSNLRMFLISFFAVLGHTTAIAVYCIKQTTWGFLNVMFLSVMMGLVLYWGLINEK